MTATVAPYEAPSLDETVTANQESVPDSSAVDKIAEGHAKIEQARQADAGYVAAALSDARAVQALLAQDAEALDRWGKGLPAPYAHAYERMGRVVKALEMSAGALPELLGNTQLTAPRPRRAVAGWEDADWGREE